MTKKAKRKNENEIDLARVCPCGWKFPGIVVGLDGDGDSTRKYMFGCPNCCRAWCAETVLDPNDNYRMGDPIEMVGVKPVGYVEPAPPSVEDTLGAIERRGTIFEKGSLCMCSDGHAHFVYIDEETPLCGEKATAVGGEIPDDEPVICHACIMAAKAASPSLRDL